ncbi:MAG TPA: hypothetical protein VLE73_00550 [Candidatus Saccharimonadales bacterium]|nr:hypothetical protein [Candidatus Saccharimonadales bacterium]
MEVMANIGPESPDAIDMAWALGEGIRASYETAFAQSPRQAEAARYTADKTVSFLRTELTGKGGLTPVELIASGFDDEKLARVISWGAFDYSHRRDDGSYETVTAETFMVPFASALAALGDCMTAISNLEKAIIAMRLHRTKKSSNTKTSDPTLAFIEDYLASVGNPLESTQE